MLNVLLLIVIGPVRGILGHPTFLTLHLIIKELEANEISIFKVSFHK